MQTTKISNVIDFDFNVFIPVPVSVWPYFQCLQLTVCPLTHFSVELSSSSSSSLFFCTWCCFRFDLLLSLSLSLFLVDFS